MPIQEKKHTKYYYELQQETDQDFLKAFQYYQIITLYNIIGSKDGFFPSSQYEQISKAIGKSKNTLMNWVRKCEQHNLIQKKGKHGFVIVSIQKILKNRGYKKYQHKNKNNKICKSYFAYRKNNVESVKKLNNVETHVLNLLRQLYNQYQYKEKSNTKGCNRNVIGSDNIKIAVSLRYIILNSKLIKSITNNVDDQVSKLYKILNKLEKKGFLKINKSSIRKTNGQKEMNKYEFKYDISQFNKTSNKEIKSKVETLSKVDVQFSKFINDLKTIFVEYGIINSKSENRKISKRSHSTILKKIAEYSIQKDYQFELDSLLKKYNLILNKKIINEDVWNWKLKEYTYEYIWKYDLRII